MTDVKEACKSGEFAATEMKPCSVLVKKLPDVISLKLGASMDVNSDLTLKGINLTYDTEKHGNHPQFLIEARKDVTKWEMSKTMHVDESICQFKDYGGMFEKDGVLKSKLIVGIDHLTTSELQQQAKVQKSQTMQKDTPGNSGYLKPTTVSRPKTPNEKSVLKRLEMKQRNLSGLDSESNCASENEMKPCSILVKKLPDVISLKLGASMDVNSDLTLKDINLTYDMKKRSNHPPFLMVACKDDSKWEARKTTHVDESICQFKGYGGMFERDGALKSKLIVSIDRLTTSELPQQEKVQKSQTMQKDTLPGNSGYPKPTTVSRPKTPNEKSVLKRLLKEKVKSHDPLTAAASSSHSGGSSNCSNEKQLKIRTKHKETRKQHTAFHSQKAKKELSSRSGRSAKNKALAQGRSRPHEDKQVKHSSSKKTSSHRGEMSESSLSKRSHVQKDCEKPNQSMVEAKIKQLPTDCGIDNWDCIGEASAPENVCDKSPQWSPDFTQQVDLAVVPHTSKSNSSNRGSLDYIQIKKEPTDCGIDDWDCIGEASAPENVCDKSPQWSPDFTQQVDLAVVPHTSKSNSSNRGSLDYIQIKKELMDCGIDDWDCIGEASAPENFCDNVLSDHLFVMDEESSDASDDDKPKRETTCKCPTTEDDVPVNDTVKG